MLNKKSVPNYYWPVYANLEKEVVSLSTAIHFSDEVLDVGGHKQCQLYTFSIKIAELLYRICAEIESIAKELYEKEGGELNPITEFGAKRDLYFDTDCLAMLNSRWELDKKEIIISAPYFYFTQDENTVLTPLKKSDKRGRSGADWKQAYQAVKHDRVKQLHKANVKHLVRALAALFLLNVYYKNKETLYGVKWGDEAVSLGSELFSVRVHTGLSFGISTNRNFHPQLPKCTYMQRYTGKRFNEAMAQEFERNKAFRTKVKELLITKNKELKAFFANGGDCSDESLPAIIREAGKSLVCEMNRLNAFEEKKLFLVNHPQYIQANGAVSSARFNQVFPGQAIGTSAKIEITEDTIEQICTLIGAAAIIDPVVKELSHDEDFKSIGSDVMNTFSVETVLNKKQEIYDIDSIIGCVLKQ